MYKKPYFLYILLFYIEAMNKMKTMTATDARQSFSSLLTTVEKEPVTIQKTNNDVAVLISSQRYNELKRIEDILYAEAAKLAIKEGVVSVDESENFLTSM